MEGLAHRLGPFIFEFQRWGLEPTGFLVQLDRFLERLPPGPAYAIEVRNPAILSPRYRDILQAHGAAHVYNHWTAMPPLSEQHQRLTGICTAPFNVLRLLTPLGLAMSRRSNGVSPMTESCMRSRVCGKRRSRS